MNLELVGYIMFILLFIVLSVAIFYFYKHPYVISELMVKSVGWSGMFLVYLLTICVLAYVFLAVYLIEG